MKLAAVSVGDPLSPRTWSGTPYNVIRELTTAGAEVYPVSADFPATWQKYYHRLRSLLGHRREWRRTGSARRFSAAYVADELSYLPCRDVLHFGSFGIPLGAPDPQRRHFLYTDATWHLWQKHAAGARGMSRSQIDDAEELERAAYAYVSHIFTTGHYVRADLIAHYGVPADRVTVAGTGRGKIAPFHGNKPDSGNILFVAKERFADKGGDLLIEGFRIAVAANPRLSLTLVSDQSTGRKLDGIPNARVTGFVPWETLERLFHEAALFAMPALNEPWGLVYLEALATRTPVLGLARNALPEITQNGRFGFLVEEPSPQAIAAAILQAFEDRSRLVQMGIEGQRYCLDTYQWSSTAAVILETIARAEAVPS